MLIQIGAGSDDLRLSEVGTREEFSAWALALFRNMYHGSELEDPCNTCAALRMEGAFQFFPDTDPSLWGSNVPLGDAGSEGNRWVASLN